QGKSSLANLIVNDEKIFEEWGKFDEVFKKGNGTLSQTKKTQSKKITLKIDAGREVQDLININKKICKSARKRVIDHLATCEDVYKPGSLDEINERISGLLNENKELQKQLEELQKEYNMLQEQLNKFRDTEECSKEMSFSQEFYNELEIRKEENELKKKMDEMMKKIDEIKNSIHGNENSIIGLFAAIGRGLDILTEMVIGLAGKALE
ncbi:31835_t:CDS:2, partial [Racocetra persica]